MKQRLLLLLLRTRGLMLPACYWKRSSQYQKCRVDGNGNNLPTANKCLFANLLFFTSREGDEVTSLFATENAGIDAFGALLEMCFWHVDGSAHCNIENVGWMGTRPIY